MYFDFRWLFVVFNR